MKIGTNAHAARNAVADGRAAVAVHVKAAEVALAQLGEAVSSTVDSDVVAEAEKSLRTASTALNLSCRRLRYTLDRFDSVDSVRLAVLGGDQAAVNRAIEAEIVEPAEAAEVVGADFDEVWHLLFRAWPAFLHLHGLDEEAVGPHPFKDERMRWRQNGRPMRLRRVFEKYIWAYRRFRAQLEEARPIDKERAAFAEADAIEAFQQWLSGNGHRVASYLGRVLDPAQPTVELMDEIATRARAREMDRWAPRRDLARALGDALVADVIIGW